MQGVIVFKLANVGSKSESLASYLYVGEGKFERVRLLGANPFAKNELFNYDGKRVTCEGEYNDDDVFMITKIALAEPVCETEKTEET